MKIESIIPILLGACGWGRNSAPGRKICDFSGGIHHNELLLQQRACQTVGKTPPEWRAGLLLIADAVEVPVRKGISGKFGLRRRIWARAWLEVPV